MKAKQKKEIEVTIIMNEFEAQWLKGLMQNPVGGHLLPDEESDKNKNMRNVFWNTLADIGIRSL